VREKIVVWASFTIVFFAVYEEAHAILLSICSSVNEYRSNQDSSDTPRLFSIKFQNGKVS